MFTFTKKKYIVTEQYLTIKRYQSLMQNTRIPSTKLNPCNTYSRCIVIKFLYYNNSKFEYFEFI